MTIINSARGDLLHHGREPCMICGDPLRYPYLEWHAERENKDIVICGKCCQKIKKGFMADLIQIAATMDLCDLHNGPPQMLIRQRMDDLTPNNPPDDA